MLAVWLAVLKGAFVSHATPAPPRRAGDLRIGDRVRCSTGYLTVTSAIVGDAVLRHVATSNAWRREAGSDIIDSADGVTSFSSHAL